VNAPLRQGLSALGLVAGIALALGSSASTAVSLSERRANVAQMREQVEALRAREERLAALPGRKSSVSPLFEAKTITLAGAALQQRLEAAVTTARGRLVSSKVEVAPRGDEHRIALAAELTIAEDDMQALLHDLETGRPYLFVDAIEARGPERASEANGGAMRVSLAVSGRWSGAK
jgi:general secretion pathway protein M